MGGAFSKQAIQQVKQQAVKATEINVEEKAHRVISRDKPVPAPRHPGTYAPPVDRSAYGGVDVVGDGPKIASLDDKLKEVYVTSTEVEEVDLRHQPGKPLPKNTLLPKRGLYGVHEPIRITTGRTTIRLAQEFITKHISTEREYDATQISQDYHMKKKDVDDILEYFETLEMVYKPEVFHAHRLDEGAHRLTDYLEEEQKRGFKPLPDDFKEEEPLTVEALNKIPIEDFPRSEQAKEKVRRLLDASSPTEVLKRIPAPEESKDMRNVLPSDEKWRLLSEEEKVQVYIEGSEEQKFLEDASQQLKLEASPKQLEDKASEKLEDKAQQQLVDQASDQPKELERAPEGMGLLTKPPENMYKKELLEPGHADRPDDLEGPPDLPEEVNRPLASIKIGIKDEFNRLTGNSYIDNDIRSKIRTPNQPTPKVTTINVRNPKRKKAANGD